MNQLEKLYNNLSKLDIQYEAELAMIETSGDYLKEQRGQLAAGRRNDDEQIFNVNTGKETYSPDYARRVKGKSEPIDLYLTGAWYAGIFVTIENGRIVTESTDPKNEMLQSIYSEQILGLGPKAKAEYVPVMKQKFFENMNRRLNG